MRKNYNNKCLTNIHKKSNQLKDFHLILVYEFLTFVQDANQ